MADVDGTAGGWGDAPPLAGGRGPKREGERHKLSASAAGQAWEHTLLLLTPIFTCRVGGYASVLRRRLTTNRPPNQAADSGSERYESGTLGLDLEDTNWRSKNTRVRNYDVGVR